MAYCLSYLISEVSCAYKLLLSTFSLLKSYSEFLILAFASSNKQRSRCILYSFKESYAINSSFLFKIIEFCSYLFLSWRMSSSLACNCCLNHSNYSLIDLLGAPLLYCSAQLLANDDYCNLLSSCIMTYCVCRYFSSICLAEASIIPILRINLLFYRPSLWYSSFFSS